MNLCRTCRFLGDTAPLSRWDDDDILIESAHHQCSRVKVIHGMGGWPRSSQEEPAVVVDGSGYASLRVLPDVFGCVLWEEKKG